MKRRWGLRTDALISGGKNVVRVRKALVTSAAPRTVISPQLAKRIARAVDGPQKCSSSPSIGRICGKTLKVDVVIKSCKGATVRAVVGQLPRGLDMAIGHDAIAKSVKRIDFGTRPATISCR